MLPSAADEIALLATTEADDALGYAVARFHRADAPCGEGEMMSLHMRADAQGCGRGKALFEAARAWLAAEGCTSMIVWVLAGNPASGFYAHLGGTVTGRQTGVLGDGYMRAEEFAFRWGLVPPGMDPLLTSGRV